MNRKLLKEIILSEKSILSVCENLNCNVDDFIDKLSGQNAFTVRDMEILTSYIPLSNPIEILVEMME